MIPCILGGSRGGKINVSVGFMYTVVCMVMWIASQHIYWRGVYHPPFSPHTEGECTILLSLHILKGSVPSSSLSIVNLMEGLRLLRWSTKGYKSHVARWHMCHPHNWAVFFFSCLVCFQTLKLLHRCWLYTTGERERGAYCNIPVLVGRIHCHRWSR